MSKTTQALELFIYKNGLTEETLLNMIGKFSSGTIRSILSDLEKKNTVVSENELYIFCDGNCKKNGTKSATAGFSVYFSKDEFRMFDKTDFIMTSEKTNNVAELTAINYIGTIISDNKEKFEGYKIIICTDSMYSINCLTKWYKNWMSNGWKNSKNELVKNKELIQEILGKLSSEIIFRHVYSHQPEPKDKNSVDWMVWNGNNIVDTNINKMLEKEHMINNRIYTNETPKDNRMMQGLSGILTEDDEV
jgi:ribonuclease HI